MYNYEIIEVLKLNIDLSRELNHLVHRLHHKEAPGVLMHRAAFFGLHQVCYALPSISLRLCEQFWRASVCDPPFARPAGVFPPPYSADDTTREVQALSYEAPLAPDGFGARLVYVSMIGW